MTTLLRVYCEGKVRFAVYHPDHIFQAIREATDLALREKKEIFTRLETISDKGKIEKSVIIARISGQVFRGTDHNKYM